LNSKGGRDEPKRKPLPAAPSEQPSDTPSDDRIQLNVGGVLFETTTTTLGSGSPNFFSGLLQHRTLQPIELFIDRDPTHFRRILNYLRCARMPGRRSGFPHSKDSAQAAVDVAALMPVADLMELRLEAEFYQLEVRAHILQCCPI
jgi:hypothetical protein